MKNELDFKTTTKKHFNKTAENYSNSSNGKFVKCMYGEIVDRILKLNPHTILDLGCGNGNILKILEEKIDADLYGLDLSENMISQAKKNLKSEVNLTVGDSENLPYDNNKFDIVICNASFHHYTNPERALTEIKRILKKDGVFILGDPTGPFDWYLKVLNYFLKHSNSGDYKIYSQKEITQLLYSSGFEVQNFKKINYRTFALNAVKID